MLRSADRRVVGDICEVIILLCLALRCQHWHWTVLGTKISEVLPNWEESRGGKSKRKEAKKTRSENKEPKLWLLGKDWRKWLCLAGKSRQGVRCNNNPLLKGLLKGTVVICFQKTLQNRLCWTQWIFIGDILAFVIKELSVVQCLNVLHRGEVFMEWFWDQARQIIRQGLGIIAPSFREEKWLCDPRRSLPGLHCHYSIKLRPGTQQGWLLLSLQIIFSSKLQIYKAIIRCLLFNMNVRQPQIRNESN